MSAFFLALASSSYGDCSAILGGDKIQFVSRLENNRSGLQSLKPALPHTKKIGAHYLGEEYGTAQMSAIWRRSGITTNVTYLYTESERAPYRIYFKDGLIVDASGVPLCQSTACSGIYVMTPSHEIYFKPGHAEPGSFQHSSFLAGGDLRSAGDIKIYSGKVLYIDNSSGHYKIPWEDNVQIIMEFRKNGVPDPEFIGFENSVNMSKKVSFNQVSDEMASFIEALN